MKNESLTHNEQQPGVSESLLQELKKATHSVWIDHDRLTGSDLVYVPRAPGTVTLWDDGLEYVRFGPVIGIQGGPQAAVPVLPAFQEKLIKAASEDPQEAISVTEIPEGVDPIVDWRYFIKESVEESRELARRTLTALYFFDSSKDPSALYKKMVGSLELLKRIITPDGAWMRRTGEADINWWFDPVVVSEWSLAEDIRKQMYVALDTIHYVLDENRMTGAELLPILKAIGATIQPHLETSQAS